MRQHARAEAHAAATGRVGRLALGRAEAALGAGHQRQPGGRREAARARRRARIEQHVRVRPRRRRREPLAEARLGVEMRHAGPPRLRRRRREHARPVARLAGDALARRGAVAALHDHRDHPGHAQLDRLLQGVVHALAARDALDEGDRER
ncbi:MAG: hypothetical protein U5K43_03725 [Halofilum sp. (in: g-proteobacteria)]|nr:hypothetical protein [Halofilum sp. (in: g-proteobacteria)]